MKPVIIDEEQPTASEKLWVMFALSLLLIATLNWYATIREPDTIAISEVRNHTTQVVSVEGMLISWIEDPYSRGENRMNAIIKDETGIVEFHWTNPGETPPIGTIVKIKGEVIEFNSRIWLDGVGQGALSWQENAIPERQEVSLAKIAQSPHMFEGEVIQIQGFISKSISPDKSFSTASLLDNQHYSGSTFQLELSISSEVKSWIEAKSEVILTGIVSYDTSDFTWKLKVQGPDIAVLANQTAWVEMLSFASEESWGYFQDSLVGLSGTIGTKQGGLKLQGVNGEEVCIKLPANTELASILGSVQTITGRLIWSDIEGGYCIDSSQHYNEVDLNEKAKDEVVSLQSLLALKPSEIQAQIGEHYNISAWIKYPIAPSSSEEKGYLVSTKSYSYNQASASTIFPSNRATWLEAGQEITANVTIHWDQQNMRLQLHIHHFSLGQTPEPVELNWANAGLGWRFLDDHRVSLIGNLSLKEGQTIVSDSVGQYWIEIDTSSIEALGWGEVWVSGRLEQYSIGATIAYRIIEANSTSGD